jgi:hypothetical protein
MTRKEIMTGEYIRENDPLPHTKRLDIHKGDLIKAWDECMCKEAKEFKKIKGSGTLQQSIVTKSCKQSLGLEN